MTWTISDHDSVAAALTPGPRAGRPAGPCPNPLYQAGKAEQPALAASRSTGTAVGVAGRTWNADRWAGDLMEDGHAAVPRRPTARPRRGGRGLVAAGVAWVGYHGHRRPT